VVLQMSSLSGVIFRRKANGRGALTHLPSRKLEAHGRLEICPRSHSAPATKLSLEPSGPDTWSPALAMTAENSVQALTQGVRGPRGPGLAVAQSVLAHSLWLGSQPTAAWGFGCPCQRLHHQQFGETARPLLHGQLRKKTWSNVSTGL
jgi:hypothetical protein